MGAIQRGDAQAALDAVDAWMVRDRSNPCAYALRARLFVILGRFDDAKADGNRLLEMKWVGMGRFILGLVNLQRGHAKLAIPDFNLAAKATPKDAQIYLWRGLAQRRVPSYDKAIDDLKKAVQFDPDSPWAHVELAELYAACPGTGRRNATKAVEHATKACQLENHWRCLDVLGMAYAEAGKFPDAIATVQKAIATSPEPDKAACRARLALYQAGTPYRFARQ